MDRSISYEKQYILVIVMYNNMVYTLFPVLGSQTGTSVESWESDS